MIREFGIIEATDEIDQVVIVGMLAYVYSILNTDNALYLYHILII